MSRASSLSSNPVLRTFAQGAAQSAIRPIANFLAPAVAVPELIGQYKVYTAKHRFKVPNTKRGLGGRAVRIGFEASDASFNCTPNALDFPMDNLETKTAAQMLSIAKYGATLVSDVAGLAHESEVITAALDAVGAGTDSNFASATVDPIAVIDAAIIEVIKASRNGAKVCIVIGALAFLRAKTNPNVLKRMVATTKKTVASVDLAAFSSLLFGNPRVEMSLMVADAAPEGKDDDIDFLLGEEIIIFASNDNPTTLDPSFMKTFRLDGEWMVPGSYQTEDERGEVLKMDWSEDVKVTNAPAAKRINAKNE